MKIVVRIFVVLIFIPIIFLVWLGMTESGLLWSYQYAKPYLPVTLKLNTIEGHLFGVMRLKGVKYNQNDTIFKANEIIINWSPSALLLSKISISKLQIESLTVQLPKPTQTDVISAKDNSVTLPNINLPWGVSFNNTNINNLTLYQNGEIFVVDKIKINASTLFTQLNINELTIQTKTVSLNVKGNVQLSNDYQHKLKTHWQAKLASGQIIKGKGNLIGNIKITKINQNLSNP